MEISDIVKVFFTSIVYKLPILLVLVGGVIYCVINWTKNQTANRKVLGGLIILTMMEILTAFLPLAQIYFFQTYGSQSPVAYLSFAVALLSSIFFAVGLGLILWAVWTNKNSDH